MSAKRDQWRMTGPFLVRRTQETHYGMERLDVRRGRTPLGFVYLTRGGFWRAWSANGLGMGPFPSALAALRFVRLEAQR